MKNEKIKYSILVGTVVCVLVLFLGVFIQKDDMTRQPTESEYDVPSESETDTEVLIVTEMETEFETETESETESETLVETEQESTRVPEEPSESQSEFSSESEEEIVKSSWVKDLAVAEQTTQMIVVAANGSHATVSMHTKNADGIWNENFSVEGRVGRNGVGKEREGDGKTPIGVYTFMAAFGIHANPGLSVLPYLQVDDTHHWVDDSNSKYYNQLVSTRDVEVDWQSSEHLYKSVYSYRYVLALNYNEACVPQKGSAIFLHCPSESFGSTAGCISIPEEKMVQVMQLLQSDCVIIIDHKENIFQY